jgi:ATP-dependent exoDNAse (exonuclease V) alpha subunit
MPDAVVGDKQTYQLDAEQQACVRYATQSPGCIKAIHGPAGSSKTTIAEATANAFRSCDFEVYAVCSAGAAAKNFREKTGVTSDTARMTLMRLDPTLSTEVEHDITQLGRAALQMPTYSLDRLKLDAKTVVFVDEASMMSTPDCAHLVKSCARTRTTMIFIGDNRQLPAIDQGGAFGSIVERCGGFELEAVRRQESEKERQRVKQLYRGEMEAVIKAYAEDGKLHVASNGIDAQRQLIRHWAANGGLDRPRDHAIFAATNVEIRDLNDMAQRVRMEAGKLDARRSITVNDETLYRGDRVLFTKKSRKLQLENGDAGTIVGIRNDPFGASVKVRLDGEKHDREVPIRVLAETHYDGLKRAYASTVHVMQGRTVDHSYCSLMGEMTDRELTYVAFSRHRKSLNIYTDENHAGVALTNLSRQATGEGKQITAKPGLKEEYSPLIAQASKSHVKTLASDQDTRPEATLILKRED